MSTPYYDSLKNLNNNISRFLVPGHKGNNISQDKFLDEIYKLDIPKTTLGIDDGIYKDALEEAQTKASKLFKSKYTWFLTNGASQANHAIILALNNKKLLIQRTSHASVFDALVLSGNEANYITPQIDIKNNLVHHITSKQIEDILNKYQNSNQAFDAVLLTSPSYYGPVADLENIIEVIHTFNIPVIIDQSWGSHFSLHPDLPKSAIDYEADLVITSIHKTLGSFTQSAMLHLTNERFIKKSDIDKSLRLVSSTSPSSILLSSLDIARDNIENKGLDQITRTLEAFKLANEIIDYPELKLLNQEDLIQYGVIDFDPFKLTFMLENSSFDAYELKNFLFENYNCHIELVTENCIIFLLSINEPLENIILIKKYLSNVINHFKDKPLKQFNSFSLNLENLIKPSYNLRDSYFNNFKTVKLDDALNSISSELIAAYPPGIPCILPGEVFTAEIIQYLKSLKQSKAKVHGPADKSLETVNIIDN